MKKQIKKLLLLGLLCLNFGYLRAQIIVPCALSISGPDPLCGSGTYTIPGLPSGISVSWSVSGSIAISGSSVSTSVVIVKTADNSSGTITATISNACGSGTIARNIGIPPSPPAVTEVKIINGYQADGDWCSEESSNTFEISSDAAGPVSYEVEIRKYPSLSLFYSATIAPGQQWGPGSLVGYVPTGTYSFQARVVTPCGNADWFGLDIEAYDCHTDGFRIATVYPNPGNTEVNVAYNRPAEKSSKQKTVATKGTYQLKLINNKGQVLREVVNDVAKTDSKIDISNIPSGTYFLHIIDKNNVIRKQVIIKH